MSPEELQAMRTKQIATIRFDYLFRSAWFSIAKERGYIYDAFLNTASHGTIAIRSHLSANGV
jgi:hypothetical protein